MKWQPFLQCGPICELVHAKGHKAQASPALCRFPQAFARPHCINLDEEQFDCDVSKPCKSC